MFTMYSRYASQCMCLQAHNMVPRAYSVVARYRFGIVLLVKYPRQRINASEHVLFQTYAVDDYWLLALADPQINLLST